MPARLVDAHCHLDFAAFDADRAQTIDRARRAGVGRFVIAGYTPASYERARALRSDDVRVAVGLHPWSLAELDDADVARALAALETLAPTADAVGELGLDAPLAERGGPSLDRQAEIARAGLACARRAGRPLVLHVVGAHAAMLRLLALEGPFVSGVVHGFGGSAGEAARWVAAGLHVSFGSALTFERRVRARSAAASVPLDRLLIESDSPDQPPRGVRGRSEPAHLGRVLAALASLRSESCAELAAATTANAERLFFGG